MGYCERHGWFEDQTAGGCPQCGSIHTIGIDLPPDKPMWKIPMTPEICDRHGSNKCPCPNGENWSKLCTKMRCFDDVLSQRDRAMAERDDYMVRCDKYRAMNARLEEAARKVVIFYDSRFNSLELEDLKKALEGKP